MGVDLGSNSQELGGQREREGDVRVKAGVRLEVHKAS